MYLFGASGHGKVVAEIAKQCQIEVTAFMDEDRSKTQLLGYEVIHEMEDEPEQLFITIGNNSIRKKISEKYHRSYYPILIHPQAIISASSLLMEGTVVMAGASINAEVKIGKHCIINTNASIDHDCVLEDYVHISPNVALAGDVYIGGGTHVGIGACVIQGIRIGRWCTIGAGAVIIKDVPDGSTVVGNPGRVIKKV